MWFDVMCRQKNHFVCKKSFYAANSTEMKPSEDQAIPLLYIGVGGGGGSSRFLSLLQNKKEI